MTMLTDLGIIFHLPYLACNLSEDSLLQRDVIFSARLDRVCLIHSCCYFRNFCAVQYPKPVSLLFLLCPRCKPEARHALCLRPPVSCLLACQSPENLPLDYGVASIRIIQ